MKVALLGTGLMGVPMAKCLAKAGHELSVWNRSPDKAQPLAGYGIEVATSAATAVHGAEIVITMLTDGAAVLDLMVTNGTAAAMAPGVTLVDMSSIRPEEGRRLGAHLDELGLSYLDAPVSGGTKGAQAGTLAIMVGGARGVFERAEPVLAAMGRPVRVGRRGAGYLAKLANQGIVAVTIGAVAEAMLLLERGGADLAAVRDALKGGFADSVILQQHGARMEKRDFAPGGHAWVQLKDLNNISSEAKELGLNLPSIEAVRARFTRLTDELGHGALDHSALFVELLDLNPES